jgi:hypothetical protein
MPDEFERFRDTIKDGLERNGPKQDWPKGWRLGDLQMVLDNQREMLACLATLARGGMLPISIAKDLQERAKKITKILEG